MNTRTDNLLARDKFSEEHLRKRVSTLINPKKLFTAIDADPALVGAGVVYIDSSLSMVTLREFQPICRRLPVNIVLKEPIKPMSAVKHANDLANNPRESRLVTEAIGGGLSCGAAVLGWLVVIGGAGAVPLSGGTSAGLTVLSYSAAIASSAQCINSVVRIRNEISSPESNDALDSAEWYSAAIYSLDLISLGGAAAAGFVTIKTVKMLQSQGISLRKALGGLDRAQRARLTREIIRINHPAASNQMIKFLQRSGQYPSRYAAREIRRATALQIKDAFGATLSFSGSALGGSVSSIAVGVYEAIE